MADSVADSITIPVSQGGTGKFSKGSISFAGFACLLVSAKKNNNNYKLCVWINCISAVAFSAIMRSTEHLAVF